MANNGPIDRLKSSILDKLSEQTWYQQLKAKWEELDQHTRMIVKYVSLGGSFVLMLIVVFSSMMSVRGKRKDYEDKIALALKIQSAQDEMKRLKEVTSSLGVADTTSWQDYFNAQVTANGIDPAGLTVGAEKPAPVSASEKDKMANPPKEVFVDVTLKKVNVRQLVKFVYGIENGTKTAKVRNLTVDAEPDQSGYLDVTLAVSGFSFPDAGTNKL